MHRFGRSIASVLAFLVSAMFVVFVAGVSPASATESCQDTRKGIKSTVKFDTIKKIGIFTVSVPSKACDDLPEVFADTYTLPADYDGSGRFNASADPQKFIEKARTGLIIRKGEKSASVAVALDGVCGWVQGDTYTGPKRLDVVTYPTGHGKSGYLAGAIANLGECTPPAVIMPEATVGTICEIGMSSAVVQLINAMSDIGGTFLVKTSDGREFVVDLQAGKIDELMFTFEGTITITVTATFGDETYDVLEQTISDEGCAQPPIVVSKPKAQIADAVCVADAEGYRLVTVTNNSYVENPLPNTDYMSATSVSFTIKSSDGFSKTVLVQAGQTETIKVPLVEDKKVTVTVSVTDTGKVLAKESFVSNCSDTEIIPPSINEPPSTLPETGSVSDQLVTYMLWAFGIGLALIGGSFIPLRRIKA